MRRWVGMALVVVALGAAGACGGAPAEDASPDASTTTAVSTTTAAGAPEVADVEALRPKASKVADLLAEHDWAAVRADFDDTMRKGLAEDGMASVWEQVVAKNGAYRSHGEPRQVAAGETVVFDTRMVFERGEVNNRVSFHADGTIAGLFLLPPGAG